MKTLVIGDFITESQKKQYKRFVENIADKVLAKAGLDKDGLQRVTENGNDLQAAIVAKFRELSVTNEYADEEIKSSHDYPLNSKPESIAWQINGLRKLFPWLGTADESIASKPLPGGAEGWFAIPRWEKVAGDLPAGRQGYNDAVEKVLKLLEKKTWETYEKEKITWETCKKEQKSCDILVLSPEEMRNNVSIKKDPRDGLYCVSIKKGRKDNRSPIPINKDYKTKFYDCLFDSQYLRQTERSVWFWKKLGKEQEGHDILIVPCQFGLRHRGRSARRARVVMNSLEFGLGAFAVGIMLLTHPKYLSKHGGLNVNCAGDECSLDAVGQFELTLSFRGNYDDIVWPNVYWFGHPRTYCGSASGFLPS